MVVAERVGDRIRDHDRAGEVDDGGDAVPAHDGAHEILVADVADDGTRRSGHGPGEARRQVVEHDNLLARVEELEYRVAADVPGPARDENCHDPVYPCWKDA